MIITKINGGLGNQMFQYAFGRQLAVTNQIELKLDITAYKTYKLHNYGLDRFNIHAEIATKNEIKKLAEKNSARIKRVLCGYLRIPYKYQSATHIKESGLSFNSNLLNMGNNVYLDGYWGSEKYFSGIKDIIRKEFIPSIPPDKENELMIQKISNVSAISIHVRRGDYVTNQTTNKFHGTCSIDYYERAVAKMCGYVSNPTFFVFSDDHQWVKENLHFQAPTVFVDINGPEKNYEDLRLMSLCKHHIIANSTFSWWGAWLDTNEQKKVITPLKWFNHDADTSDFIPNNWERI